MKFSIIVPAHNEEHTIRRGLDSIKSQSFRDYEIIVVCDSCTDRTKDIARQYTDKVYEVEFGKACLSRNVGLTVTDGEWVLFMDADDWYLHEFVFDMLNKKLADEDVLLFSLIWRHIGYCPIRSPKGTIYPHVANKCWRREFIGDTKFPRVYPADDGAFLKLMMAKNPKITEWDMPLYYYNFLREGSISDIEKRTSEATIAYWKER